MKRIAVYRIGNVNVCIVQCWFLQKISTIHHEISTVNRHTKGYCINLFWMIIFVKLCITYAWMLKGLSDKLTGISFIKLWQQTLLKTIIITHVSIMKIYYYWIGFSFTKESRPKLSIPSIDSKKYLF